MNKFIFFYKFFIKNENRRSFNLGFIFPFLGVIIGCITVSLTFAIMEGMEFVIFNKLKNVSFPSKIINISKNEVTEIEKILIDRKMQFFKGIEGQVIIMKNLDYRLINIHAINDFSCLKDQVLGNDIEELTDYSGHNSLYIGKSLSLKLDISLGDTIAIISPKDIEIITGLPRQRSMVIAGIFKLGILDYDQNYIFADYKPISELLSQDKSLFYLNDIVNSHLLLTLGTLFTNIRFKNWWEDHLTFISAMKLEKYVYSIVGFLIIAIAGFTLLTMMTLSIMKKVSQIGILRAMGATKKQISILFLFQVFFTWIVSTSIGILLSICIIKLDANYHFINIIFPSSVFFEFPLMLDSFYIILISIISLLLLLIASLYPVIKAANMNLVHSIGYKR